ncbi:hypothetical protein lerEdw1_009357 [Lerista edwardsae]|nr:hypothetical protein lerEdw1_009357 [Lerista edwardsae]
MGGGPCPVAITAEELHSELMAAVGQLVRLGEKKVDSPNLLSVAQLQRACPQQFPTSTPTPLPTRPA